jgi:hypothetical protein
MLTVKSRDGKTIYNIKLADNAVVRGTRFLCASSPVPR